MRAYCSPVFEFPRRAPVPYSYSVVVHLRVCEAVCGVAGRAWLAVSASVEREQDCIANCQIFVFDVLANGDDVAGTFVAKDCWEFYHWE